MQPIIEKIDKEFHDKFDITYASLGTDGLRIVGDRFCCRGDFCEGHESDCKEVKEFVHSSIKEILEELKKWAETGKEETVQIGCPDNNPGCLVYHCKTIRKDITAQDLITKLSNEIKELE